MLNSGLSGPYDLNDKKIDQAVAQISPGTYILGYLDSENVFIVKYVGRSDNDLNERLHNWVDDYEKFKASYFDTAKEAFEKECKIYHDFGGEKSLDNEIHPDRPDGKDWECLVCTIYDN